MTKSSMMEVFKRLQSTLGTGTAQRMPSPARATELYIPRKQPMLED